MSADTTVVIAAYRHPGDSELSYTAAVVQAADNITYTGDKEGVLEWARVHFLDRHNPCQWFTGKGGLSRAKQFANLLAQEWRENFILEYEDRPIIEIAPDRIYLLSRKGRRKDEIDPECYEAPPAIETHHSHSWEAPSKG